MPLHTLTGPTRGQPPSSDGAVARVEYEQVKRVYSSAFRKTGKPLSGRRKTE